MNIDTLVLDISRGPAGDDLRLNLLIWVWKNGYQLHATSGNAGGGVRIQEGDSWRFFAYSAAPQYLSSVDAARTLIPPGWSWNLDSDGTAILIFEQDVHQESVTVVAANPARALTLAAIKATELLT